MLWVEVRGFRSIRRARLELGSWANFLMGLNDHGKSNFLRAIHLLFTGRVEPAVALDFDRDLCNALRGKGVRQQIVVTAGIDADLVEEDLLSSIKRKMIFTSEGVSVRRIWRRSGIQTALVVQRGDQKPRVYAIREEGNPCVSSGERAIDAHAPIQFARELERLVNRFHVHYLPSNKAASSLDVIGLSRAVKHYLLDPYARSHHFKDLGETLAQLRNNFDAVVQEKLGPELASALRKQFPGMTATGLRLPADSEELIATDEIYVSRDSLEVPLSACGSGLQSLLMLEILALLDSSTVPRSHELQPRFVWLIEEPEAFLYEDLVHHVGARLEEVGSKSDFTVLCTSHSREVALATEGDVAWVKLARDGTRIVRRFDLEETDEREEFDDYARAQFGTGIVEAQLAALAHELKSKADTEDNCVLVVEGKHDKRILEACIKACSGDGTPDITVMAPVTGSQNAEHVKHSVLMLSELPKTFVVGLFDNDYEGTRRCKGLNNDLAASGRRNATALLIPCPEHCKAASTGYLASASGGIVTRETGHTVDLRGKSLTIEALYDHPKVVEELREEALLYNHWVVKPVKQGLAYDNMKDGRAKARAAEIAASHAAAGRCGSLELIFDLVVKTFQSLAHSVD